MSSHTEDDQRAVFADRFQAEHSWREGTRDDVPQWFDTLLTDLILAIGESDIRYFSAHYEPGSEESPSTMAVVVFTDDIVAYANLDEHSNLGMSPFEVIVTARRALTSFTVESEITPDGRGDPLEDVRITVIYPRFSRSLPLGGSAWSARSRETSALLRQLRSDLVA